MAALAAPAGYAAVLYLTAPAARPVVAALRRRAPARPRPRPGRRYGTCPGTARTPGIRWETGKKDTQEMSAE